MKRSTVWLAVVIIWVGTGLWESAAAQDRLRVHAAVGVTKALSPTNFSNRYRVGFNSSGTVGYEIVRIGLEPIVSGSYTRYRIDPAAMGGSEVEIDGGGRSIWAVSVGTLFHMNSGTNEYNGRRHLYLVGQIGLRGLHIGAASLRTTGGDLGWERRDEVRPGAVVGLGMEFPVAERFSVKLEPALDIMFTKGERTSVILLNSGLIFSAR